MCPVDDEDQPEVCGYCRCTLDDTTALEVDISRPDGSYLYAMFCKQEHAAEWMARPLPEFRQLPSPSRMPDGLVGKVLAPVGVILAVGLMGLGLQSLVHLIQG
jgi:hypothetical protein